MNISRLVSLQLPLFVIGVWVLIGVAAPLLPLQPNDIGLHRILAAPGVFAGLGHDDLGRALFDRLAVGAGTSFYVAVVVISISLSVGTFIGLVSGYVGGWLDQVIVRVMDMFLAFPGILLAITLAGLLGPGINNVVIALSVVSWVGFARLARAQVLSVRQREHVQAAIALGSRRAVILRRHILPLILAPMIVEASFGVASVVIAEAGLSFLGLGVQPPDASWGTMIRDGARYILVAPHAVIVPGAALMLVVLSVNLLGDRLQAYLDVRRRLEYQSQ